MRPLLLAALLAAPLARAQDPAGTEPVAAPAAEAPVGAPAEGAPTAEVVPEAPAPEAAAPEAPAPEAAAPEASVSPEVVEALLARIEALEAEVKAQRVEVARQGGEIAKEPDFRFEVQGLYRTRAYTFGGMFDDVDGLSKYMDHRLRITPIFRYKKLARLEMTIDGLDNVVWGDNASLQSVGLFAMDPSVTNDRGFEAPSMRLERVWAEMTLPVGVLRVGRMGSDWGMGLLANDGNGFDDDFGDNRWGSTVDRVLFATRPVAIAQAIAGKDDSGFPLIAAIGVDRLVEEPLIAYYGYTCTPNVPESDPDYDRRCDRNDDGLTDLDHGYDEDRTADQRGGDWWAESEDDVVQVVAVLIYRGEGIRYLGAPGDLTAGMYLVARHQDETDSKVLVLDGYLKAKSHGAEIEGEILHIGGQTRAIALPGSVNPDNADDPLFKKADIWGYAVRAGWGNDTVKAIVEHGYASGDGNVADERFTGRPLHPDYNVGLILYEEVMARVTATLWTDVARGLWSEGGVFNSRYLMPKVHFYPFAGWAAGETEVVAAWIMAWPDRPDGSILRCREGDRVDCSLYQAEAAAIGWEADLAIKHTWHKHLVASLEGGYAHVTDRVPLEAIGLDPDGNIWTFQARAGFQF